MNSPLTILLILIIIIEFYMWQMHISISLIELGNYIKQKFITFIL